MRAARRIALGKARVEETSLAAPGPAELVVDVLHAAVNPFDLQVLDGDIGPGTMPLTLGAECVGRLDGDLVLVSGSGLGSSRDGTFAEQVVVPRAAVRRLPEAADPILAATVGIAGSTGWRIVHELAQTTAGDVVIVLGSSGGVGMFAAQFARATGARVVAQAGTRAKAEILEELGLETVVAADPRSLVDGLGTIRPSVVLDPWVGSTPPRSCRSLRPVPAWSSTAPLPAGMPSWTWGWSIAEASASSAPAGRPPRRRRANAPSTARSRRLWTAP